MGDLAMSEERYEPIAPVNTNIGGDDANKFAVKYKKEIPHIYEILNVLKNLLGDDNPNIVVDEALSDQSINPVQNKAITRAFENYYSKSDVDAILENWSGITGGGSSGTRHSYRVTIYQTAHQVITVKKIMDASEETHVSSFLAEEQYERLEVSIEADNGYIAGELNCENVITLDRDIIISATEATEITANDSYKELYWPINDGYGSWAGYFSALSEHVNGGWDDLYLTDNNPSFNPQGKNIFYVTVPGDAVPYDLHRLFNILTYFGPVMGNRLATKVIMDFKGKRGLQYIRGTIGDSNWLQTIELRGWNTREVELVQNPFNYSHPDLRSITGLNNWDTSSLLTLSGLVSASRYMTSLDLSNWGTPRLTSATNIFPGEFAKALDISGWDTSHLTAFSVGGANMEYLIMNAHEVKFSGSLRCHHPNNYIKYLVPADMVSTYKNHANWADWADQIDSVDNYTYSRINGQVNVTPIEE